jgi:hypothetical protein
MRAPVTMKSLPEVKAFHTSFATSSAVVVARPLKVRTPSSPFTFLKGVSLIAEGHTVMHRTLLPCNFNSSCKPRLNWYTKALVAA